ncbi:M67 family metallopeptidase [Paenibacillus lactis]|uniref:M67 family metallopeptidase n=1 Tax=Paenibacillus lactis TaxID=228574 RepID=UPI00164317A7
MNKSENPFRPILLCRPVFEQMAAYTYGALPQEACGILIGQGNLQEAPISVSEFIPVPNTAEDPLHHFRLEPAEWTRLLLSKRGIIGLFHSHPSSHPEPSRKDLADLQAFGGLFSIYFIGTPVGTGTEDLKLNAYRVEARIHKDERGVKKIQSLLPHTFEIRDDG